MTTVIGVFDNGTDLEVALNRLYDRGINDVRVVDRAWDGGHTVPAGAVAPGTTAGSGVEMQSASMSGLLPFAAGFGGLADDRIDAQYLTETLDLDLDDDEARFYANALRKNGKLLIVNTDDDQTDLAWSVMRNSNASQYVEAD